MSVKKFSINIEYIPKEYEENVKNFKYNSTNNSYIYNYFSSPIGDKLVDFIPTFIAPNVVS